MSNKFPDYLIVSDETLNAYAQWLERIEKEPANVERAVAASLMSTTLCRLLAEERCVNEEHCTDCRAAKKSFVWMRRKWVKDGVVLESKSLNAPFEVFERSGVMTMSEHLNVGGGKYDINLSIHDGFDPERESDWTKLTMSTG